MSQTSVLLYQNDVSDLPKLIDFARNNFYDAVAVPLVHPLFYREFDLEPMKRQHITFSRSDLILEPTDWLRKVISVISDYIDCDSQDEQIRRHSEQTLLQEFSFAEHLVQNGHILIRLKSKKTINLARLVSSNIKGTVLVVVPFTDPASESRALRSDLDEDTEHTGEDTWLWWNNFRLAADFHPQIKLVLEMTDKLPPKEAVLRWLGEPVECILLSSDMFIRNKNDFPVLSKARQELLAQFIRNNSNFIIKSNLEDDNLRYYAEYIRHLTHKFKIQDPMQGSEDWLQFPLQPLFDNLDSYTYELFEQDPVKYKYYQDAIEQALRDKVPDQEINDSPVVVMVVGAGRGPLARAALNASVNTQRRIKLYIIEKNPNAIITLTALVKELWHDKDEFRKMADVEIISCDMRDFKPHEKADILVSELLGSFGDNELSPECLDGAQKHLKPDGISIPCQSTSYINPIMSSKIYNSTRQIVVDYNAGPRGANSSYPVQSETTYVVYLKSIYNIAEPQPLFTFDHPNNQKDIDNSRFQSLKFEVSQNCVLHGFGGYFDTVLYKDIVLSTHPQTHTQGLITWYSVFFPLTEPQQLKSGDTLELNFWRCLSSHKVWYEWSTSHPYMTHVHNHNGRSCFIYK